MLQSLPRCGHPLRASRLLVGWGRDALFRLLTVAVCETCSASSKPLIGGQLAPSLPPSSWGARNRSMAPLKQRELCGSTSRTYPIRLVSLGLPVTEDVPGTPGDIPGACSGDVPSNWQP